MTSADFKKLLDEAIKPLKQDLNLVKQDLNLMKQDVNLVKQDLSGVKQDLSGVKQDLSGVKQDLSSVKEEQTSLRSLVEERILPPLIYIETTVKSYADRYVANEDHIGRLNTRLVTIEDKLGVIPPQELTIPSLN